MAKPMTKTQLVAALAEEMGSDKKSAGAALEAKPREAATALTLRRGRGVALAAVLGALGAPTAYDFL